MSSAVSGSHQGDHVTFTCHVSSGSSCLCVSQTVLAFDDLGSVQVHRSFIKCPSTRICPMFVCFLMMRLGLCVFERRTIVKVLFSSRHFKSPCIQHKLSLFMLTSIPWSPGWGTVPQVSPLPGWPPFPFSPPGRVVTLHSPHLSNGELSLQSPFSFMHQQHTMR